MRSWSLAAVVAAWFVTRAVLVVRWLMGANVPPDTIQYHDWASSLAAGAFPPSVDLAWQYPPGTAFLLLLPHVAGASFTLAFVLFMILLDAVVLATLIWAGRQHGGTLLGAWAWVAALVIVGPASFLTYDVAPTALAVLGIALASRPVTSGIALGLGAIVKVWPGVLLLALPRRSFRRAAVAAASSALVVWVLASLLFDGSGRFLVAQGGRGLQVESVAAFPYAILLSLGGDVRVIERYGSMEVVAPGTTFAVGLATVLGVAVIAAIAVARFRGRLESVPVGDVALTLVLVLITMSRVNSPQYGIWIAGVAAVALANAATLMRPVAAALGLMLFVTSAVYASYLGYVDGDRLLVGLQGIRIALLVGSLAAALVLIWRHSTREQPGSHTGASLPA